MKNRKILTLLLAAVMTFASAVPSSAALTAGPEIMASEAADETEAVSDSAAEEETVPENPDGAEEETVSENPDGAEEENTEVTETAGEEVPDEEEISAGTSEESEAVETPEEETETAAADEVIPSEKTEAEETETEKADTEETEEEADAVPEIAAEGHCLAFASDLHGLGETQAEILNTALAGFPRNTEYISLIGDLVGDRGGDAPAYNAGEVYDLVHTVMDWIKTDQMSIIWADHDKGVVNQDNLVKCEGGRVSGQICEGENYYIYGVGFYHMTDGGSSSREAAEAFKDWVKTLDENKPILVLCHVPIQAKRGDNLGAPYWNEALNYAATGVEGISTEDDTAEIIRNVIFLYGHNHTADKTEYVFRAGTTMSVQIDTNMLQGMYAGEEKINTETEDEEYTQLLGKGVKAKAQGVVSNIYYTAMIPGYLKTSGSASLLSITDSAIRIAKYKGGEAVSLGTDGATGETLGSSIEISRILWGEPEYEWSEDLSEVTATRTSSTGVVQTETAAASSEVTKNASCEEKGEKTYTAGFENPAFESQTAVSEIPASGHDWSGWKVTKKATASEEGEMTRTCRNDPSHVWKKTIPASGEEKEAVTYSFSKGKNGSWTKGSSRGYELIVKRSSDDGKTFSLFTGILVDGKMLDKDDYTASAGSLRASLNRTYLETLSAGSHTLKVTFTDGSAVTRLQIRKASSSGKSSQKTGKKNTSNTGKKNSPKTGDDSSPESWGAMMMVSGALLVCLLLYKKRMEGEA